MAAPWDRPGSATSSRQQHAHTMTQLVGPRRPVAGPIGRMAVAVALATGIIFPPVVPRNPGPTRPFKVRSTFAMCCGTAGCAVLREWRLCNVPVLSMWSGLWLMRSASTMHGLLDAIRYPSLEPAGGTNASKRQVVSTRC